MKLKYFSFRLSLLAVFFFVVKFSTAQVTVWSVDFNNGCASDCIASTYGGWTILDNDGGVTGGAPNNWFVSCAEEGIAPPGCGSSCIGDASLHIGANPGAGGDMGASFNETGASNATFRMATSPTVSTVGYTGLTLNFDFIAFGSAACSDDRAQLRLSTDNGATWPVGFQYCLTSVCCGACNGYSQGQWTLYTLALPAAFDNNPNVRVGFHWRNNGNGSGTDPSVAIDDVRITTPVLPVNLVQFRATEKNKKAKLDWVTANENGLNTFQVERSAERSGFTKIGTIPASGSGTDGFFTYFFEDQKELVGAQYYRLKMVDVNGNSSYSNVVRVVSGDNNPVQITSILPKSNEGKITIQISSAMDLSAHLNIVDAQGKEVINIAKQQINTGENTLTLNASSLSSGVYFLRLVSSYVQDGHSSVSLMEKFILTP